MGELYVAKKFPIMRNQKMTALAALITMLFCSNITLGNYAGAQKNPNGTWVLGGAHKGAQKNPDGTWVVGGAYKGAQKNPDGTWVVGWKQQAEQDSGDNG